MKIEITCTIEVPDGFRIDCSLDEAAYEFMPEDELGSFPKSCQTIMNLCDLNDLEIETVREVE